jgi:hypothetical protein
MLMLVKFIYHCRFTVYDGIFYSHFIHCTDDTSSMAYVSPRYSSALYCLFNVYDIRIYDKRTLPYYTVVYRTRMHTR